MAAPAAGFKSSVCQLQWLITPVSSNRGCDESRQTPIRIKQVAVHCLCPGGVAAPEERWCRFVSKKFTQNHGCRRVGANPLVAHVAGDPLYCKLVTATQHPMQTHRLLLQSHYRVCRSPSLLMQNSALRQTVCTPSECGSRPAPACGPTP